MAVDFGLSNTLFESDCLKLVNAVNSQEIDDSGFGVWVEDIKASLLVLPGSSFAHVHTEANVVAHKLARFGTHLGTGYSWFGDTPPALQGLLVSSCNN